MRRKKYIAGSNGTELRKHTQSFELVFEWSFQGCCQGERKVITLTPHKTTRLLGLVVVVITQFLYKFHVLITIRNFLFSHIFFSACRIDVLLSYVMHTLVNLKHFLNTTTITSKKRAFIYSKFELWWNKKQRRLRIWGNRIKLLRHYANKI